MLKPRPLAGGNGRRRQLGVVLVVALIMLIVMTLAALALVRSPAELIVTLRVAPTVVPGLVSMVRVFTVSTPS